MRGSTLLVPDAALSCLERSADTLREAMAATEASRRYALAHVAALRAAAAVLAARARPVAPRRGARQRNAWVLLVGVAPELEEWATFFAAGAAKRAAAEAGSRYAVTAREADDLVRDADRFLAAVETALGLVGHAPIRVA
ncbi:MAG: SAV_6107 family HEPN domain-containing protein [Marmoricola sp.]